MITTKIKHLKLEQETWLRTLAYIQQENVHLKNCLADIIKDDINAETLEEAEYYQNQFINRDAVILLLRYDVAELYGCLSDGMVQGTVGNILKNQAALRTDMEKMEHEFSRIKFQFNSYLATAL